MVHRISGRYSYKLPVSPILSQRPVNGTVAIKPAIARPLNSRRLRRPPIVSSNSMRVLCGTTCRAVTRDYPPKANQFRRPILLLEQDIESVSLSKLDSSLFQGVFLPTFG